MAAITAATITASAGLAHGNGRFPASINVQHIDGDDQFILLPVTFGLLMSTDDGASFRWICENAIGYSGVYDPDYALEDDGTLWATTFDGLRMTKDRGCNWQTIGGVLDGLFVDEVEIAPNGTIWVASSSGSEQNDVFYSTNGSDFTAAGLLHDAAWWRTLRIAPGDANRIYVTGFQPSLPNGDAMTPAEALLYVSTDAGTSWTQRDLSAITFGTVPQLDLLGVAPDDPDTLWAAAVTANDPIGDSLYVSTNGGTSWSKILDTTDTILTFLVEAGGSDYTLRVGTIGDGARVSTDGGTSWTRSETPRQACLSKRSDGTYFSCGANWEPDFFALGRSTDGTSWSKVVRFSELAGPVSCDPGTVQFDTCESQIWPDLAEMFGIGGAGEDAGPGADAAPQCPDGNDCDNKNCLGCSSGGPADAAPWLLALWFLLRRRERVSRSP